MFRILKKQFNNLDYTQGNKKIDFGDIITYYEAELTGGGIWFTIPSRYRSDFQLSLMKIGAPVPPHTDSEIKTSINF